MNSICTMSENRIVFIPISLFMLQSYYHRNCVDLNCICIWELNQPLNMITLLPFHQPTFLHYYVHRTSNQNTEYHCKRYKNKCFGYHIITFRFGSMWIKAKLASVIYIKYCVLSSTISKNRNAFILNYNFYRNHFDLILTNSLYQDIVFIHRSHSYYRHRKG